MDALTPKPRAVIIADWLLRIAVVLFALGLARALFTRAGTSLGSLALLHAEVPHSEILLTEKIAAAVILFAALTLLVRPTVIALLAIALPIFAEAYAGRLSESYQFSTLTPFAHALRYLTPLALIPIITQLGLFGSPRVRQNLSAWLLRLAIAIVFVTHGYEAWKLHPYFIDYLISAAEKLANFDLREAQANQLLKGIAILDFTVGAWLIIRPNWTLLIWLSLWGLVTAVARPLTLGFASYPEVLLRAPHFLAPIALGALLVALKKTPEPPKTQENPA